MVLSVVLIIGGAFGFSTVNANSCQAYPLSPSSTETFTLYQPKSVLCAKKILIPMSSVGDIQTIPGELFAKFQTSFYSDPVDGAFKALGVE